ncbi:MAG: flavodoxin [Clostridia bacterium]|nr:flavodoxin [Clostridia bacterium]
MTRVLSLLLAACMLLMLAACGSTNETTHSNTAQNTGNNTGSFSSGGASASGETETDSGAEKKILVLYFSAQNAVDADVVSGATPRIDNTAATAYLANLIHEAVGGELAKISAVETYPAGYNETADQAKANADGDKRPAITVEVDPTDYDVLFIGYPIWWYTLPMEMYTFFDTYDLSGKTVIPFNTHAGSRDGGTYRTVRDMEPDAAVLDGLAVSGESVSKSADQVKNWLAGLAW